jgi:hypothetical protein
MVIDVVEHFCAVCGILTEHMVTEPGFGANARLDCIICRDVKLMIERLTKKPN